MRHLARFGALLPFTVLFACSSNDDAGKGPNGALDGDASTPTGSGGSGNSGTGGAHRFSLGSDPSSGITRGFRRFRVPCAVVSQTLIRRDLRIYLVRRL